MLRGQETDLKKYTGSHDPNMHAVSSEAGSARSGNQSGVIQNLKTEHLLTLSNHGKILPTSVVQASMMEADPSEASQRLTEMVAALAIVLISIMLGMSIGLIIYLVWKGKYWGEMRMLVRATVDLVYLVANIVRDRDQREVGHDSPPIVDENVGEGPDEETGPVRSSYHCCGEIPNHEGCDDSDDDTAELDMNDESSGSDDSSTVVVTDPAGKRYVVSQLPRGVRPVGIVRPH